MFSVATSLLKDFFFFFYMKLNTISQENSILQENEEKNRRQPSVSFHGPPLEYQWNKSLCTYFKTLGSY